MPVLRAGYAALALKLQESMDSGDALSAGDIRCRLSDAINDAHRGSGKWAYYIDHFGDGESGDVIYCCDGDTCRASYSITDTAGAAKCVIDIEHAEDVVPRTIYEPEAEEEDHYAAMAESQKAAGIYASLPLYERFIAKAERDNASSDDFAGKGKSFPILKPEDVSAAARSIGRAGSGNLGPSGLKARIIAIATRKGWQKYLPKAWQGEGSTKESEAISGEVGTLRLVESCAFPADITIREALSPGKMIKLIAPGKGSTAYYTVEVLKQASRDRIFHAGLPMRIDHPTEAEQRARPEGSVKDWGAVLESDAIYRDDLPSGPGLYAPIKQFSDHAQTIDEKGPYAGVSICANGNAVTEAGRVVTRDGVPVLKEFTSAEGADMVTRAGAGGMFLQESARTAEIQTQEAAGMTEAEAKKLIEAAVSAATAPLRERALRGDAREEAMRLLESINLPSVAKTRIIERSIKAIPATESGEFDVAKFREIVVTEARSEGEYLAAVTGSGRVFGMGAPAQPIAELKPEQIAAREAALKAEDDHVISVFESITGSRKVAEMAAKGRAA